VGNPDDLDPKFTRHVRPQFENNYDLLRRSAEEVTQVLMAPGWVHIQRLLVAEIESIDSQLDNAAEPLTQSEYAMAHGRRRGLRGALRAAYAIVGVAEQETKKQVQAHERGAEPPRGA
jgi:hypothetical protein